MGARRIGVILAGVALALAACEVDFNAFSPKLPWSTSV